MFIYCSWVVSRWQCLFYMYTKREIDYYWIKVGRATWEACSDNLESWEPFQQCWNYVSIVNFYVLTNRRIVWFVL